MKNLKYFIGILLLIILVGCTKNSDEKFLEKQREEKLLEYVKSFEEDTEESVTRIHGTQEEVEELLGLSLSDYKHDDSEMGSTKTQVYNLVIQEGQNPFPNFSIEEIKAYFVDALDLTVSDFVKKFGKPTEISVYRSSRYNHDAHVILEWRLDNLNDTENVKSLEIEWNIWDNSDTTDRQVEVLKYSNDVGYDLRTEIMVDGDIQ